MVKCIQCISVSVHFDNQDVPAVASYFFFTLGFRTSFFSKDMSTHRKESQVTFSQKIAAKILQKHRRSKPRSFQNIELWNTLFVSVMQQMICLPKCRSLYKAQLSALIQRRTSTEAGYLQDDNPTYLIKYVHRAPHSLSPVSGAC